MFLFLGTVSSPQLRVYHFELARGGASSLRLEATISIRNEAHQENDSSFRRNENNRVEDHFV